MKIVYVVPWTDNLFLTEEPEAPGCTFVRTYENDHFVKQISDAEGLVITGTDYTPTMASLIIENAHALRWIQSSSIGMDRFFDAGLPSGILLSNAAGLKGRTVAEHAFTQILSLFHRIPEFERNRQNRAWRQQEMRDKVISVEGKTIVIVGYGSIGQELARKAHAFDMRVIAVSRKSLTNDPWVEKFVPLDNFSEVLGEADIIAPCVPLTDQTHNLIGANELAQMKPSAYVINISRGAVVDERALSTALTEGTIAGAGLDVYLKESEMLPKESKVLWGADNVVLTPHIANAGGPGKQRLRQLVFDNIAKLQRGDPLINQIETEIQ